MLIAMTNISNEEIAQLFAQVLPSSAPELSPEGTPSNISEEWARENDDSLDTRQQAEDQLAHLLASLADQGHGS